MFRIPFADADTLKLAGEAGDDWENDFVRHRCFPQRWHPVSGGMSAGNSVAIFGAEQSGFSRPILHYVFGASVVYVVDYVPETTSESW